MRNLQEGLRWLDQADADMKTARDCFKDGNLYASAFFAQQASEKRGAPLERNHLEC